jgi:opacity protein-like surface antigen
MDNFKRIFLMGVLCLGVANVGRGAVITLRDQTKVEGTVVSATARDIQVHTGRGEVTIATDRIARIDYSESESPPVAAAPAAMHEPPTEPTHYRVTRAESYRETHQTFSLGLGAAIPLSRVDFSGTGGGTESNGDTGILIGGRYLFDLSPNLSVGPDLEYFHRSRTQSQSLLQESNTDVFGNTLMLLANAKWSFVSRGPARPYLLGGVGANRTSTIAEGTPNPGFSWSDTDSTETRTLVDQAHWGFASHLAFGIDFPMWELATFGLEFGWVYLGNSPYEATPAGRDVGLTSLTGSQHALTISGRWSWRY